MQKLAEICIRRPVFATMIILTLVVVGGGGLLEPGSGPVSLRGHSGGADQRAAVRARRPSEMETEVAQPIEEAVNTIEGIDELRSINGDRIHVSSSSLSI